MSIRTHGRYGAVLLLALLVSGCSSVESMFSERGGNECQWNRSRCLYEGAYEPGERDYAEQEARRLNQAALDRLRRGAGG
ncbi:hypothetical protein [Castellaniella sp. GW247-6E4]|uniref:hypothetical protein n=1 Tax=Castellaniella sp. GW247-6E4 TaxID=3140380 RepID=UPI00331582AF